MNKIKELKVTKPEELDVSYLRGYNKGYYAGYEQGLRDVERAVEQNTELLRKENVYREVEIPNVIPQHKAVSARDLQCTFDE